MHKSYNNLASPESIKLNSGANIYSVEGNKNMRINTYHIPNYFPCYPPIDEKEKPASRKP